MSQKQNKRTKSWGALLIPRRRRRWNRFAFDENGTYRERLKCVAPPEHFFFRFRFENPVRMHLWQHWTWKGRCAVIISCRRRGFACVMLICFTSVNWFNLSQIAKMLITSLLVPLWLVKKGDFFYQSLIGLTWQGCHSATIAKTDDGFKCLMQPNLTIKIRINNQHWSQILFNSNCLSIFNNEALNPKNCQGCLRQICL